MKKILIIITTGFVSWGGLTTVAMNYYRVMGRDEFLVDFLSDNDPDNKLYREIKKNGSQYYKLPNRKKQLFQYMRKLYSLLKKKEYDIVHIHGNSATMAFDLLPSWFAKVPKRITHIHTSQSQYFYLNMVLWPIMKILLTDELAVSTDAGRYLYHDNDYMVLNNAIDTNKYRYREDIRSRYRKLLCYNDSDLVVGTVGKINAPKNHKYLVEIFAEVLLKRPEAKLLIVGDGEQKQVIEKLLNDLSIESKCILLGMRLDTAELLSTMDIFVFPSLFEGFGLALLEAQASGLVSICSESLPKQVMATDLCRPICLSDKKKWVDTISEHINTFGRNEASRYAIKQISDKGLEISNQVEKILRIYRKD